MSKYDIVYLRSMSISDIMAEPVDERVNIMLEHLEAIGGTDDIYPYCEIFFKIYKPEQLSSFLLFGNGALDIINENDPDFIVQFKYKVIKSGDDLLKSVVTGILAGYGHGVVRHLLMFTYVYLTVPTINLRILVDFFSRMDSLSDSEVKDCTRKFISREWTTNDMVAYLANGVTLSVLYRRWNKEYDKCIAEYVKSKGRNKTFDTFTLRELPIVESTYKVDRRVFEI